MTGWLLATAVLSLGAAQEPVTKQSPPGEVHLLWQDLKQLLEAKDPDAILLSGEEKTKYLEALRFRDRTGSAVALECRITGEVRAELAHLTLRLVAKNDADGPQPLAVGFGETKLLEAATTDGRPARVSWDEQGLIVWLEGKGQHSVAIDLLLPLAGSPTLPAMVCSIPEAPVTTLDLRMPRAVSELKLNPAAPIDVRAEDGGKAAMLSATLGLRKRVELQWHWADGQPTHAEPLFRAASETTATVEPGVIRLRTDLRLHVLRGAPQAWVLLLGAEERVLDVKSADDQEIKLEQTTVEGEQRMTVRFPTPVTGVVELSLTSELPWQGDSPIVRGPTVVGALGHRSYLAIQSAPELDVAPAGLVNARVAELLPVRLRSPRNEAAFAAHAQPYQVKLSVLPRRPTTSVRTLAVLSLSGDKASIFERWQFTAHGGKVSQVGLLLPPPFDPSDFVASDTVQAIRADATNPRIARVFLKGTPDEFELRLRATVPLALAQNLAKLDLPRPLESRSEISKLYLATRETLVVEPTAELEPLDEPLGAALIHDLDLAAQTVRGFETGAMLDRVAFRVSRLLPRITHETVVRIDVEPERVVVRQQFDYSTRGGRVSQLRLSVPQPLRGAVTLDAAPGRLDPSSSDAELVVRVDQEPSHPMRVEIRFLLPRESASLRAAAATLVVPLVRALDGPGEATELLLAAPATLGLRVAGNEWVAAPRKQTESLPGDTARIALRQERIVEEVKLEITQQSLASRPELVVDRALIETTVGTGGEWQTRCRFYVSSTLTGKLRLAVPPGCRVTELRLGDRSWLARAATDPRSGGIVVETVGGEFPDILEVQSHGAITGGLGTWVPDTWSAPVLVGDVSWGRVLWQFSVPERFAVLRGPAQYSDENQWRWSGRGFRSEPRLAGASLDRWLTGEAARAAQPVTLPAGQSYLYSRLAPVVPVSLTGVSRPALMLMASGSVMLFGLVLAAVPMRGKSWLALVVAAGVSCLCILEPNAAVECSESVVLSAPLVFAAALTHWSISRRRSRRRTVFPEAAVLAKAQGSSLRSGSGSSRPNALADAKEPVPTTTSEPRRAVQPSSLH